MLSSTTTIEPDRAGRADRAPRVERAISTRDAKLWKLWPPVCRRGSVARAPPWLCGAAVAPAVLVVACV